MNKLMNYVVNGKGVGALLLLAFAFLTAVYFSVSAKSILTDSIPYMQQIADNVLPIKVENGQVVVPAHTIKEINLFGDDKETYPFVIDTTTDTLETANLPEGIYLTHSYFYTVTKTKTQSYKLTDSFDLPQQDYTPFFKSTITWIVILTAAIGTALFFLISFILTLFYAFCAGLAAAINKKQLAFDVKMRLSAVIFIAVFLFSSLLGWVGLNMNMLLFFLIVIALQIVTVKKFRNR